MFKTLFILVLVFAGIRFVKNIILMKNMPNKKEKRDYQKMDIQDAEYKEINDE
jgi:hypothetical protein